MKKLLSYFLVSVLLLSTILVFPIVSSAEENEYATITINATAANPVRVKAAVGSTINFIYKINVWEATEGLTYDGKDSQGKIINCDIHINYSNELKPVYNNEELMDHELEVFPILSKKGGLMYNSIESEGDNDNKLFFNYTNLSGASFADDNSVLCNVPLVVEKSGEYKVNIFGRTICAYEDDQLDLVDNGVVVRDKFKAAIDTIGEIEKLSVIEPTEESTEAPTEEPTVAPTEAPTEVPTEEPTEAPIEEPTEAPTEPEGPFVEFTSITPIETGIQFKWNAFDGAQRYNIYLLDNETGEYVKLMSKTGLSYTYLNIAAGTTYTFNVRPYKVVDGKTTWLAPLNPTGISYTTPNEVVNLKGNVIDTGLRVSWDAFPQAERYLLYRQTAEGKWAKVGNSTTNTSMVDTTVEQGNTYTYTVRPYKMVDGKVKYLADYSTQTLTYAYEAITNCSVTRTSKGLRIAYPSYEDADKYMIYVKDGNNWVKYSSSSNLAITYKNPVPGTTYTFCVRAYNTKSNVYLSPYDEKGTSIVC